MSLIQMSFSGAVMILAIIAVRVLALNRLPKKIFVLLWAAVLLRLLIPFSIPSVLSAYSFVERNETIQEPLANTPINYMLPKAAEGQINMNAVTTHTSQGNVSGFPVRQVVWIVGVILCAAFFIISYLRCYFEFRTSLPVRNEFTAKWLEEYPLKRSVQIRQSDRISTPLTYGIFRPVVLMPKNTDWENGQQLQYVLLHEYMHIRHFDMMWKLIAAAALCVHWSNPVVWAMYIFFNRDIELYCDESVVRQFGDDSKVSYAKALITMEEKRRGMPSLGNNFSKNAIEKRITAIMKTRKRTVWAIIGGAVILVAVIVLFATSSDDRNVSSSNEQTAAEGMVKAEEKLIEEGTEAGQPAIDGGTATGKTKELVQTMTSFYEAYFSGDKAEVMSHLVENYPRGIEVYEDSEHVDEVEIKGIKGLSDIGEISLTKQYTLSLEFVEPEEDSLTYLVVIFEYENDSWKVNFYGLEK